MKSTGRNTRERILAAAARLFRAGGVPALTFDAIAGELGISKQAVLYWFPSKAMLIEAAVLPSLESEAATVIAAIDGVADPAEAIERCGRALAAFHFADLERFRLMYLVPQVGPKPRKGVSHQEVLGKIHSVTGRMYEALARIFEPELAPDAARRLAFAIHSSVLGLVLMHALADAVDDPLRHRREDLLEALLARLSTAPCGR